MLSDWSFLTKLLLSLYPAFVFLAWGIGAGRNSGWIGFLLGVFLGPLGAVASYLIDWRSSCPACGNRVPHLEPICPCCDYGLDWSSDKIPVITSINFLNNCPFCSTPMKRSPEGCLYCPGCEEEDGFAYQLLPRQPRRPAGDVSVALFDGMHPVELH